MNPIENSTGLELLEQVMAGVKELPEIEPRPDFTRQVMFNIKEKEKPGRFVFPSLILTPFQLIFSPFFLHFKNSAYREFYKEYILQGIGKKNKG